MPKASPKPSTKRRSQPKQGKPAAANGVSSQRPASLSGYRHLAGETWRLLWANRVLFGRLALLAWLALLLTSGVTEQAQYSSLSEATHEATSGVPEGTARVVVGTWILFSSVLTGSLSSAIGEGQQLIRAAVYLFLWLVVIWLTRRLLADSSSKLRDGLYSAGAPTIPTLLIGAVGVLQLLPLAVMVTLFAAIAATGALNQAVVTAVMAIAALALSVATLYWLSATLFALVIVTIPGTYPLAALRSARRVVAGYRPGILLRLLWLGLLLLGIFCIVTVPFLYLDVAFGLVSAFFMVALTQLLSVLFAVYGSVYIYRLYREVIDERAE